MVAQLLQVKFGGGRNEVVVDGEYVDATTVRRRCKLGPDLPRHEWLLADPSLAGSYCFLVQRQRQA